MRRVPKDLLDKHDIDINTEDDAQKFAKVVLKGCSMFTSTDNEEKACMHGARLALERKSYLDNDMNHDIVNEIDDAMLVLEHVKY